MALLLWRIRTVYLCLLNIPHKYFPLIVSPIANSVSRILALSSHSVVRCPLSVRPQASHPSISPLYDILDHTNQIFSESLWHPLSTHPPPLTRDPNTNTQIHKYTNKQIQLWLKLNIGITCAIFLKRLWYEDLKNNVHEYRMWKYTNTQIQKYTNTQIHKYASKQIQLWSKLQIDLTYAIFLKR